MECYVIIPERKESYNIITKLLQASTRESEIVKKKVPTLLHYLLDNFSSMAVSANFVKFVECL